MGQVHEDMLPEGRVWSVPRYCPLPFPPLSLHTNTPSPTCAKARGLNAGALHCTQVPYSCTLYRLYWQLYTLHIVLTVVHFTHCTDSCTLYTWYWQLYTLHIVLTVVKCTHCNVHTVHMVLTGVHCTHGTDSCTLSDWCTFYTLYWQFYTVHMVLTVVHFIMYTAHKTENSAVY